MTNRCRKAVLLTFAAVLMTSAGCAQMNNQRLKSPIELFHTAAFGGGLTRYEYTGSDVAREWDMEKHAQSLARQQAAVPMNAPGNAGLQRNTARPVN